MSQKPLKDRLPKFKGLETFEERSKKFFKKVGESFDTFVSDIFDSAKYTLFPKLKNMMNIGTDSSSAQPLAIFWDYDNFPLLKNEDLDFFYDQIIPDEKAYNILVKKVFSLKEQIDRRREFLEKKGFEIIEVPHTGKKNETDLEIFTQCIDFCNASKEPTSILLITGDRDFVFLTRRIIESGHDVSLICSDKSKLSAELRKRVPKVVDRNDLFKPKNYLKYSLEYEKDPDIWKNKWQELKSFYSKEKDQYRLLRYIYHRNEDIAIRNIILQELEELA